MGTRLSDDLGKGGTVRLHAFPLKCIRASSSPLSPTQPTSQSTFREIQAHIATYTPILFRRKILNGRVDSRNKFTTSQPRQTTIKEKILKNPVSLGGGSRGSTNRDANNVSAVYVRFRR